MDGNYTLSTPLCTIAADDVDKLLSEADGGCALLYLYLLRNGGESRGRNIAGALQMSRPELNRCAEKLRSLGLLSGEQQLPPADELPEYTAEYIVSRSRNDKDFRGILSETERALGRTLSSADMKTLFGIYDSLGLPAEVVMLLVHHCVEEYQGKYGPGRMPTMRYIEKEAYFWANREVLTLEAAEEFLEEKRLRGDELENLRRTLGIRDREFSNTEKQFIDGWLDMGFKTDALELAYDRTVTNTGQLKWNYMNKIIQSWHAKGLHTPEEIENGDRLGNSSQRRAQLPDKPAGSELDRMKKIYDKVKNGQG